MYDGFIKKERGILFFLFCVFVFRMSDDDGDEME